jgi:aspartate ammonia-lyase
MEASCQELIDGKLHDQFQLDVFQGGAGTSTNMNANEVIANRALERMGHRKGEYRFCDPHDHVNASQSTNDAYPTALHVAMALGNVRLVAAINELIDAFRARGRAFASIVKMGRTQLQDAVPMTLGQEFTAFGETLAGEVRALESVQRVLCEINMGATAIGTGLNAPAGYAAKCTAHLARITGFPIHLASDLIEATQDTQAFVLYSACMKSLAIKLSKVCNDLRLLSSGPRCGFREINLPPRQPGSSIMPGKVNPVIPEVVNMVCFRVIGSDLTVSLAAEAGQLQLNVFEPVIAACIFEAQTMFINAAGTLRMHCVDGITANADVCRHYVEYSIGTVTALNPVIGYERATELAAEAMRTGRGILELVRERKVLSEEQIAKVLDPISMTGQERSR